MAANILTTKAIHMSYTKLPQAHLKKQDRIKFLSFVSLTFKGVGGGYPLLLAPDVVRIREPLLHRQDSLQKILENSR